MSLPEPDALVKPYEYEKFHALFERSFPRPKRKAQIAQWKFKREIAWLGWRLARETPHVEPRSTLTIATIKGLTPAEFDAGFRQ